MKRALAILVLLAPARALAVYQCGNVSDTCQCGGNNPYPCCDNGGNCTWYAWEEACCSWGVALPGWGNANQWAGNAAANASYQVLSEPVVNAVSCNASGQYGHVAFVTALNGGGNITVHEENCWGGYGWDTANYASSFFTGGFIVRAGQVACSPGDSQSQSCGNCGTQSRGCGDDGNWGGWSACSSEGECAPGATDSQACGTCGTQSRTCSASCTWDSYGACSGADPIDAGSCDAGLPGPCGVGAWKCVDGNLNCAQVSFPEPERCDGVDNDCDGTIDDHDVCPVDAGPREADGGKLSHAETISHGAPGIHGGCASAEGFEMFALVALAGALARRRKK